MNHPIASVSLALFTAFAGSAATLHAGTDVHVHIGLGPVITRSSRGREIRSFEPGYYSYRDERVWVNFDRDHNDRGHDGRGWDRDDRR